MSYCTSYAFTHPGNIRMTNEDAYFTNDTSYLWIVCDGMGGHQEGSFASHLVTDIFEEVALKGSLDNKIELIRAQFYNIFRVLQRKVGKLGNGAMIGTTFVLLLVEGNQAVSIHSGDSRCYMSRNKRLSMITQDHAQIVSNEQGSRKMLTNALCAPGELFLEIKTFQVYANDTFLLCTDGFYDNLTNSAIREAMENDVLEHAMHLMSTKVLSEKADDNLTAVLVRIK
jgi:serine/threonine protein phosphatase PrpC